MTKRERLQREVARLGQQAQRANMSDAQYRAHQRNAVLARWAKYRAAKGLPPKPPTKPKKGKAK